MHLAYVRHWVRQRLESDSQCPWLLILVETERVLCGFASLHEGRYVNAALCQGTVVRKAKAQDALERAVNLQGPAVFHKEDAIVHRCLDLCDSDAFRCNNHLNLTAAIVHFSSHDSKLGVVLCLFDVQSK